MSSKSKLNVTIKRAYEQPEAKDGTRILVDRLWPRGLSKEDAAIKLWLKEIAPSTELRKWFGHDPARWAEFKLRYRQELDENPEALETLRQELKQGTATLVYGAKDEEHNHAIVLRELLQPRNSRRSTPETGSRKR